MAAANKITILGVPRELGQFAHRLQHYAFRDGPHDCKDTECPIARSGEDAAIDRRDVEAEYRKVQLAGAPAQHD